MKKLYSYLDVLKFPIAMLFLAIILIGLGDFFQNPNVIPYININNQIFLNVCNAMKYIGRTIIDLFPLLLVVKSLAKRYEDSVPVFNGVVAYIIFNVVTMMVSSTTLPSYCYTSVMGIQTTVFTSLGSISAIKTPLLTGFVGAFLVVQAAKFSYNRSRKRFNYGILSFIDNDVWSLITTMVYSALLGLAIAFLWPYVIMGFQNLVTFIASNIYSPSNMFLYGVMERVLDIFGLQDLLHNPFWFGAAGGSWMDAFGQSYTGDINIWTVLINQNALTGSYGRFITPFYIINIFAIPGMMLSFLTLETDKLKRKKRIILLIIGILVSVLSGTLLPIELYLVVTAPALFFIHVALMSTLYAVLPMIGITVGYTFSGSIGYAMPGTLVSYLPFLNNANYVWTSLILLGIGIGYAVLYFLLTRLYYRVLSSDFLDFKKNREYIEEFISAVGGIKNIRIINSSLTSVSIHLYNQQQMIKEALIELGAYRITETRAGIELEFGPRSSNIQKMVNKRLKIYKKELMTKPTVQAETNVQG